MQGSRVARLRFRSQRSSSAGGVGGSSSSQEEICAVFSLAAENDDEGNVPIIRCVAVGVVRAVRSLKQHSCRYVVVWQSLAKGADSDVAFLQPSN